MSMLRLAIANLRYRRNASMVSVLLLVFGVALISVLMQARTLLDEGFSKSVQDVDMVVGAKGSPLQLILANVFHIDNPTGNIPLKQIAVVQRNPLVAQSVQLSYGDYLDEFRILGASSSIYPFYHLSCSAGRLPEAELEVVLGSEVAKSKALKVGSTFGGSHGSGDGDAHADLYKVVGVLKESGTVMDKLVITPLTSIWHVHEHGVEAPEKQITAMLVKFKSPMGVLTVPGMINRNTSLMAAIPAIEMNRLLTLFDKGFTLLYYLTAAIVLIAGISVFLSLVNSLRDRKYELALLRLQGASRGKLFSLILLEAMLVCVLGSIIGLVAGHGLFSVLITEVFGQSGIGGSLSNFGDDWVLIPGVLVLAFFAALFPAITAYRLPVTELLKDK